MRNKQLNRPKAGQVVFYNGVPWFYDFGFPRGVDKCRIYCSPAGRKVYKTVKISELSTVSEP